jgi:peptidoglycan/xylan/chitin deacetylase (PgdA/CDA1 family)
MMSTTLPDLRVVAFGFHEVVERPEDSGFHRPGALAYKHRPEVFVQYLDAIAGGPVPPTLVDAITAGSRGDRLLLTFDDGGVSAMRAAELLEARGWRGHFLITTGQLGKPGFLARADVCELARRGHRIGSHSHSHPNVFYDLSDAEMLEEWRTSFAILSDIIGAPAVAASIPGGDMDARVAPAAERAGARYLFTSEPVLRPWRHGALLCLGRVCPKVTTSVAAVCEFAHFRGFRKAMAVRRVKQALKRLLGPIYRQRVRQAARRLPRPRQDRP